MTPVLLNRSSVSSDTPTATFGRNSTGVKERVKAWAVGSLGAPFSLASKMDPRFLACSPFLCSQVSPSSPCDSCEVLLRFAVILVQCFGPLVQGLWMICDPSLSCWHCSGGKVALAQHWALGCVFGQEK